MTSRKVQPFLRFARSRAFTIVELLVAISVLTLIVLVVLYVMRRRSRLDRDSSSKR